MDKSLLIAIFVPTDAPSGGKCHGLLGTGYPAGPDLVLTARHLLHPEPPRSRSGPIRIRWEYHRQHPEADHDGWLTLPDAAVVWEGRGGLDAALLRCPRPESAIGWGIVSAERPADGMEWVSEGFPHAGEYAALHHPCSFGGKCYAKAPAEDYFEMTADAPPESESDWRGASGMPIFVGRRILGIAGQVPQCFDARRLHATPCWKLLADPEFRRAVGYDDQQARVAGALSRLARILTPAACEALAEALPCPAEFPGLEEKEKRDCLAARLLETDIRLAINALRKAHKTLLERSPELAAPLVEAARWVVPVLFDRGVVRFASGAHGLALVPLPAGTHTVAEIIMAGADGREARFHPREDEYDQPRGELALPLYPEQGIDGDRSAALAEHLRQKLDPASVKTFRSPIDDYLLSHFGRSDPGAPVRQRAERIQLAADLLRRQREDSGQTFYMLFFLPEDPAERETLKALVQGLKTDYEAIAFLGLDPAFEQERRDRDLLDSFCRMLPLKATPPGDPPP